jgi:hypothetical protein
MTAGDQGVLIGGYGNEVTTYVKNQDGLLTRLDHLQHYPS